MKNLAGVVGVAIFLPLAVSTTPIKKVLELLSGLENKITVEGEVSNKAYEEFTAWCKDRSANLGFDIKTSKSDVAELKASIEELSAKGVSLTSKISDLSESIATDDADLIAATQMRAKEAKGFTLDEKEMVEIVDTLTRAISIIEREMQKGGASMMQLSNARGVIDAMQILVQSSALNTADASKLTVFLQNSQANDDTSDELGAPAAAVYESHSSGLVDTLGDLLEKAQEQLAGARKKEIQSLHNFKMLEQSLKDQLKFGNKDMATAKRGLSQSSEKKATNMGDLEVTSKDLAEDITTLAGTRQDCTTKAANFESETASRAEELKALAEAKRAVHEMTGGAESLSYGLAQMSFLQLQRSQLASGSDLAKFEAVRLVRDLARKHGSTALAQLADRMSSSMRLGTSDAQDPFAKVKGLIKDMVARLEDEEGVDATQKAYCDKETSESEEKKGDLTDDMDKLSTKIDQMNSRSARLKAQVAELQHGIGQLVRSQAEMDKMRQEEHSAFVTNKADMQQGIAGVQVALKVLREYYAKDDKAHASSDGDSSGIVGLLEVVESDFSKGLAEMGATEEESQVSYVSTTKENAIVKVTKQKDVEYKTKASVSLDKAESEAISDRSTVQAELAAVVEYLSKLEDMCVAKPEPYAERARRRVEEIAGLQNALQILEGEASLLQQTRRTGTGAGIEAGTLRGTKRHV